MITLSLTQEELLVCTNVLNEVCTGFHVPDFEHVIGSKADAAALHERLDEEYCLITAWPDRVQATPGEVRLLVNAARATLQELDYEREFHTRVGATRAFAYGVLAKLEGALAAG